MNLGISSIIRNSILNKRIGLRHYSAIQNEFLEKLYPEQYIPRTDSEWLNAKDFSSLPGPSKYGLLLKFLPGGDLYNLDSHELFKKLHNEYGDIFLIRGAMGEIDSVISTNVNDMETVHRNESLWPIRLGLKSLTYYRKYKRPDIFQGNRGLLTEQGKNWADFRNKLNPIMMKPQNVRPNLPQVDEIAQDFIKRLDSLIDPSTGLLRNYFVEELHLWSFETMGSIVFNRRMNSMVDNPDPRVRLLRQTMSFLTKNSFQYDLKPSFWKYYESPGFKKFLKAYDTVTDIAIDFVNDAIKIFESENNLVPKSTLEKIHRIDKNCAIITAMDMLMGGVETMGISATIILYYLSKNLDKQNILYEELCKILPTLDSPLTEENTSNMPYLKACIKEAFRLKTTPLATMRITAKDIILSGYRIPRGTSVTFNRICLTNREEYFPRSAEFIPERWLKNSQYYKDTNPFVSLPFGFGPRSCIGKRFADLKLETLIIRLLRKYEIRWAEEDDMKFICTSSTTPKSDSKFQLIPK